MEKNKENLMFITVDELLHPVKFGGRYFKNLIMEKYHHHLCDADLYHEVFEDVREIARDLNKKGKMMKKVEITMFDNSGTYVTVPTEYLIKADHNIIMTMIVTNGLYKK